MTRRQRFDRHWSPAFLRRRGNEALVLLVEGGLAADLRLRDTVNRVFDVRGDHEVPVAIVDPPNDWRDRFAEQAAALDVRATSLDEALKLLRDFWRGVRGVT